MCNRAGLAGEQMKRPIVAALLTVAGSLMGAQTSVAQEPFRPLSPAESRALHECMYTVWVDTVGTGLNGFTRLPPILSGMRRKWRGNIR